MKWQHIKLCRLFFWEQLVHWSSWNTHAWCIRAHAVMVTGAHVGNESWCFGQWEHAFHILLHQRIPLRRLQKLKRWTKNLRPAVSKTLVALVKKSGVNHLFLLPCIFDSLFGLPFAGDLDAIAELHSALSTSEGVKLSSPMLSSFRINIISAK